MSDRFTRDGLESDFDQESPEGNIEFTEECVNEEVKRGILLRQSWMSDSGARSKRVYTQFEQAFLPLALQDYISALEAQGILTPLGREWILDAAMEFTALAHWREVPMDFMVETIFLIQGIEGVRTGQIPLNWKQQQPEGVRIH